MIPRSSTPQRNFMVQAFLLVDNCLELWEQKYFITYELAFSFAKCIFSDYDSVTISKVK